MGNADTKLNFRKAVIQLTTKTEPVEVGDDAFWDQFWCDSVGSVQDVFTLVPSAEIRALREESPSNLATLCYKAVERLVQAADASCRTHRDQTQVLNSVRLLTRIIPYMFEDPEWRDFFWSPIAAQAGGSQAQDPKGGEGDPKGGAPKAVPLAQSLLNAVCDLLFCPEFTVAPNKNSARDEVDDLTSLDSCEYIWAAGVGFAHTPSTSGQYDQRRKELLRLLETCFSQNIYVPVVPPPEGVTPTASAADNGVGVNKWVQFFTSSENRHALPLFTSLLNIVCGYDPAGILPYNHLLFHDSREELVEVALQVLIVSLDQDSGSTTLFKGDNLPDEEVGPATPDNLFLNYLSRIHREEDFGFVLRGVTRLLMNPLEHTYLPGSQRKVQFHQELLIFFWKFCENNRKFLFYVLKSGDVLHILTPILHHLNEARGDHSRVGLVHIGVFILLLLSGERNFGVRLNKPYTSTVPMDIPVFTGTHGDLLIIVFHKIITAGHQRLQPLFDCLLTILCNVSPYVKSMSMIAACKLLHLLEAFGTPWFLYSSPTNHHLVFFLLEMFNNIIQYQFDGNSNLIYTIIRKRQVIHSLTNLPTDCRAISKSLLAKKGYNQQNRLAIKVKKSGSRSNPAATATGSGFRKVSESDSQSSAHNQATTSRAGGGTTPKNPAPDAEEGPTSTFTAFKASLMDMPALDKLIEKESAHPSQVQLDRLTRSGPTAALFSTTGSPLYSPPASPASGEGGGDGGQAPAAAAGLEGQTAGPQDQHVLPETVVSFGEGDLPYSEASTEPEQANKPDEENKDQDLERPQPPPDEPWIPTQEWVKGWKAKLPLQTIMRMLQVLVPQVEKICIDKGLTDESEILRFLQHGTLVGLLPVPHPILIRKYQPNPGTSMWFRTYMWGVIYLRNTDPPIWYDTDVRLFEIQRI